MCDSIFAVLMDDNSSGVRVPESEDLREGAFSCTTCGNEPSSGRTLLATMTTPTILKTIIQLQKLGSRKNNRIFKETSQNVSTNKL